MMFWIALGSASGGPRRPDYERSWHCIRLPSPILRVFTPRILTIVRECSGITAVLTERRTTKNERNEQALLATTSGTVSESERLLDSKFFVAFIRFIPADIDNCLLLVGVCVECLAIGRVAFELVWSHLVVLCPLLLH